MVDPDESSASVGGKVAITVLVSHVEAVRSGVPNLRAKRECERYIPGCAVDSLAWVTIARAYYGVRERKGSSCNFRDFADRNRARAALTN